MNSFNGRAGVVVAKVGACKFCTFDRYQLEIVKFIICVPKCFVSNRECVLETLRWMWVLIRSSSLLVHLNLIANNKKAWTSSAGGVVQEQQVKCFIYENEPFFSLERRILIPLNVPASGDWLAGWWLSVPFQPTSFIQSTTIVMKTIKNRSPLPQKSS